MKIIDAHVHMYNLDNAEVLYRTADRFGYNKINLLSLSSCASLAQNIECAACKLKYPERTYVFGGLEYNSGRDFRRQAELIAAMGFDGFKMLEGKPTTRKILGIPLDSPRYDGFYDLLEETQLPLLMHVADPHTFWDKSLIPNWALKNGWFYDDSFIPYEQLYVEVDNLLAKHPKLKLILAHFYFLSWNIERAKAMLDRYPNIYFDITSGIEMYQDFSKDVVIWAEFFETYAHRIIYGTDSTESAGANAHDASINGAQLHFLRGVGVYTYGDWEIHGAMLSNTALEKILGGNFMRLTGPPKILNVKRILEERAFLTDLALKSNDDIALEKLCMLEKFLTHYV